MLLIFGEFEGDLWSCSRARHVWLKSTPRNQAAAELVWERDDGSSASHGVTTFRSSGRSPSELYRMLPTVDLHHGEDSASTPWTAIHVRGIPVEEVSAEQASVHIGSSVAIVPESKGFAVVRASHPGTHPRR